MKTQLFTDAELDRLESTYVSARDDNLDALKHNINLMTKRIQELERAFRHYHKYNPESGDTCVKCGLDLRDPIHIIGRVRFTSR